MDSISLNLLRLTIERFVPLSNEEWGLLEPHVSCHLLLRGEHWIREVQLEKSIGMLLKGNMRHYYVSEGEEKTTYFYFENNLVSSYFSALTSSPFL